MNNNDKGQVLQYMSECTYSVLPLSIKTLLKNG